MFVDGSHSGPPLSPHLPKRDAGGLGLFLRLLPGRLRLGGGGADSREELVALHCCGLQLQPRRGPRGVRCCSRFMGPLRLQLCVGLRPEEGGGSLVFCRALLRRAVLLLRKSSSLGSARLRRRRRRLSAGHFLHNVGLRLVALSHGGLLDLSGRLESIPHQALPRCGRECPECLDLDGHLGGRGLGLARLGQSLVGLLPSHLDGAAALLALCFAHRRRGHARSLLRVLARLGHAR
mmetsp:Transcript_6443/g.22161  ORF Transcript_6443/g.22161 Transcript_6443/m.22161 type:complete len:235 (-) Transcript_6443:367-1071(-)